jgi:hypothetical protein
MKDDSDATVSTSKALPYDTLDDPDTHDDDYKLRDNDGHESLQLPSSTSLVATDGSDNSQELPSNNVDFANFEEGFSTDADDSNSDKNIITNTVANTSNVETHSDSKDLVRDNGDSQGSDSQGGSGNSTNGSGLRFFTLTKKNRKKTPPKVQLSGIVNYGVGNSDSESSDASITSISSISKGYDLPYNMQANYQASQARVGTTLGGGGDNDNDDASIRTPFPTGPPDTGTVLASAFLRNRNASMSNVSDLSEEEEASVVKRQKREEENVGRLVLAAKQQQSFAQAWFSAGKSENANALPKYVPPKKGAPAGLKKKTSFQQPEASSGPIDLDSGDVWDGDAEEGSKSNWEVGSFNYTTHSGTTKKRRNRIIKFGVPEDEDLTTYNQGDAKCGDRVVCTVGNTRCSLLALIVLALGLAIVIVGGTVTGIYFAGNPAIIESNAPSLSPVPTMTTQPSIAPTEIPSSTPSLSPSLLPSISPTQWPTSTPSSSPSLLPTSIPSQAPTLKPSPTPSISLQPTSVPSSAPSSFFSDEMFEQISGTIKLNEPGDRFGETISINESGTIVAVGARQFPDNKGSVTVYEFVNGVWKQKGDIIVGLATQSIYGPGLDMSQDGLSIVIGEYEYDTTHQDTGAVRVFTYNETNSTWDKIGSTIEGEQGEEFENSKFGYSVAISDDGTIVAIGAPDQNNGAGVVYVFRLNDAGLWEALGDALTSAGGAFFLPNFGFSVSLSGDGKILACGVPLGSADSSFVQNGVVEVFQLELPDTNSSWSPYGLIDYEGDLQNDFSGQARFGDTVSLSRDGSRIAIGAVTDTVEGKSKSGSVFVYEYNLSANMFQLVGNPEDPMNGKLIGTPDEEQLFGESIAISRDGAYVVVGAQLASFSGSVSIYRYNGMFWDPAETVNGNPFETFGKSVAITVQDLGNGEELVKVAGGGTNEGGIFGIGVARVYQWQGTPPQ